MPRLGAQVPQGPAQGSQDTERWVLLPVRREDSQLLSTGGPSTGRRESQLVITGGPWVLRKECFQCETHLEAPYHTKMLGHPEVTSKPAQPSSFEPV